VVVRVLCACDLCFIMFKIWHLRAGSPQLLILKDFSKQAGATRTYIYTMGPGPRLVARVLWLYCTVLHAASNYG